MQEVIEKISVSELKELSKRMFDSMVKAVVDVELNRMVVDVEMHVDAEQYLLENDSRQTNLWGINLWPGHFGTAEFVEFDSLINIRPRDNNRSLYIEDAELRRTILDLVAQKVFEHE